MMKACVFLSISILKHFFLQKDEEEEKWKVVSVGFSGANADLVVKGSEE